MNRLQISALILGSLLIFGCQPAPEGNETSAKPAAQSGETAQQAPPSTAAPEKSEELDKQEMEMLAGLDRAYEAAKKAYEAKTSDAKLKTAYIDATMKLANATLVSPPLAPREKYPKSLSLYREVLKVDAKNTEAASNKKMIEDIYKSMGRPVPQ